MPIQMTAFWELKLGAKRGKKLLVIHKERHQRRDRRPKTQKVPSRDTPVSRDHPLPRTFTVGTGPTHTQNVQHRHPHPERSPSGRDPPTPRTFTIATHTQNVHNRLHTPSTAFRHLPPNSAIFGYATGGALFISAQLSGNAVSAL